jgi:hypothetical protein
VGRLKIYAPAAIIVLVVSLVVTLVSVAGAAQRGQVGGPPSIALGSPDEGKRTTPDLVIGRRDASSSAVELVAYGWLAPPDSLPPGPRRQLCVWAEHLPRVVNFGMCGLPLDPNGDRKLVIDDRTQALGRPAQRFIEIGGRLTPDVASVRIFYSRNGRKGSSLATVAQVTGALQGKLHQVVPFGYFDARISGQVPWGSVRVQAYGATGAVLETAGPASSAAHRSQSKHSSKTRSSQVSFEGPQSQIEFSRKANNGYSIFFEANRGKASLTAQSHAGTVIYSGKSSLADGRIRFSLGKLGMVDLRFEPDGSVDRLRPPRSCKGREQVVRNGAFVGSIRFRGETGYTQLSSRRVHGTMAEPRSWKCPDVSGGRPRNAAGVPILAAHTPQDRIVFAAIGGVAQVPFRLFVAGTSEQVGALRIQRSVLSHGMRKSFEALDDLSLATVAPSKPFSGSATFVRNADGSTEWSGTLGVALPGAPRTALTGPAFQADLARPRTAEEFAELLGLDQS